MDKEANKKKGGLGRGLGAILTDHNAYQQNDPSGDTRYTDYRQDGNNLGDSNQPRLQTVGSIATIEITSVETNPFQPRT
jgi:hypothetical protein